ncbi:MAG: hypothetical protein LLG37_06310 [Spirochaetia bacterium]|nr:hypothetical protein [Spirochaetia bacterium]
MNLFYKIMILLFMNGLTAAVAQAVLGREVGSVVPSDMNLFCAVMAAWVAGALIAVFSVGSFKGKKNEGAAMNYIAGLAPVVNAFYAVGALFFTRYYRAILKVDFLATLAPHASWLLCAVVFMPVSALLTASILADINALEKAKAPNFGPVAAGVVFAGVISGILAYSVYAVKYYGGLDIIYTLGIVILAIAYLFFRGKDMQGKLMMLYIIGALILYFAFNVAGIKDKSAIAAQKSAFNGYEVIKITEFPTVNFVMAKKDNTYYILENGLVAYKMPDETYAAAAQKAKGPRVLAINGGFAGLAEELAKNKEVKEIVCVEAEPYIGVVMEKVFGPSIKTDKKVEYKNADSALSVFDAAGGTGLFDTVVVTPRMKGTVAGKYYDSQKFKDAAEKLLNKGGEIIYTR